MENQQDEQQGHTRQPDIRLDLDEFTSLATRGRSGSTSHLSRPLDSHSVATSVATSAAGLRVVSKGFAEVDANPRKRSAKDPGGVQKRNRNSDPISEGSDDLQAATQEIASSTFYGGWAALQLATQLLQHEYEEIAAAVGTEDPNDVIHGTSAQVQQEAKCKKCAAEEEDYLYD
ncbi:hypothetical protein N7490_001801 [Penicillium lividum]|nr:hypothetical protein N7490_001801 [Penicillium lividum]